MNKNFKILKHENKFQRKEKTKSMASRFFLIANSTITNDTRGK